MEEQNLNNGSQPAFQQTDIISTPNELEPVLTLINYQGYLGKNE